MSEIYCKRCGAGDYVKNGIVREYQRYRCNPCGFNFTLTPPRGKPPAMKALAVALYSLGDMSFCGIGRLLGVSDVTVLTWVRNRAEVTDEPVVGTGRLILIFDEMWHFLKKRLINSGYGELSIRLQEELSHGSGQSGEEVRDKRLKC